MLLTVNHEGGVSKNSSAAVPRRPSKSLQPGRVHIANAIRHRIHEVGFRRIVIAPFDPKDVAICSKPLSHVLSVAAQFGGAVLDHFLVPPFIAAFEAHEGRCQQHQEATLTRLGDHVLRIRKIRLVRGGKVTGRRKGTVSIYVVGRVVGEVVLDEFDEERVESFLSPIFEVLVDLLTRQSNHEGPRGIAVDEEWLSLRVQEVSLSGFDVKREHGACGRGVDGDGCAAVGGPAQSHAAQCERRRGR